ncbi:hypothetical protein N0V90_008776 [Kalmusia sp. IMI 367209]|nr:hypothetical protein N0V90_008776 [Kalmusia sp. IMI 367209]
MEDLRGLEDLFPSARSVPAKEQVYRRVRICLARLSQVRALIREDKDYLLQCDQLYLDMISERFEQVNPDISFRLDDLTSIDQLMQETRQARTWLLRIIVLQARYADNHHFIRILRSAHEKPESAWSDLERLYMALSDLGFDDAEDRLDYAFALVLHYNYAEKHRDVLKKLQEIEDRRLRLAKKKDGGETVRARILDKVQSVKVDNFACAVPVSTIADSACEDDHACPICRNKYLDFVTFPITDLISDYPVKIKYCGHVIGKGCLETWMATPLADPAKYPHRTCPLCRVEIEGGELPPPPRVITQHVDKHDKVVALIERLGLEDEECWDGLLRLISEEIALGELKTEVEGRMMVDNGEEECLSKAKETLKQSLAELVEEKKVWGFGGREKEWAKAKKEWVEAMLKT